MYLIEILEGDFDGAAEEMIEKSGQRGVPVILIEGREEPLVGFDQDALEEALNL